MRQPSPSHYGSWPRIFGFVLKEAESRLACSSCLYLQERGQGGPLFLDDTEKNFCPPTPRDGSATELCQLRVLIREETWEITLKYLSQALLSNASNNKNELKSVRLNKFSKTTLNLVILFWILSVPPFVFAVPVFVPSFNVLSANYFSCYTQVGGSTNRLNFLWHRSWYVTVFLFNGTNKQRSIHLNAKIKERDRLLTAAPVGPGSPQK